MMYQADQMRSQIIEELNTRTQKRVDASEDFAKDLRQIERYKEQKERDEQKAPEMAQLKDIGQVIVVFYTCI